MPNGSFEIAPVVFSILRKTRLITRYRIWYFKHALSLFSSHRKNLFAARCECLHIIKMNSQCLFARCESFLIRCRYSQRAANQFLRWLEKRLYTSKTLDYTSKRIVCCNLKDSCYPPLAISDVDVVLNSEDVKLLRNVLAEWGQRSDYLWPWN